MAFLSVCIWSYAMILSHKTKHLSMGNLLLFLYISEKDFLSFLSMGPKRQKSSRILPFLGRLTLDINPLTNYNLCKRTGASGLEAYLSLFCVKGV